MQAQISEQVLGKFGGLFSLLNWIFLGIKCRFFWAGLECFLDGDCKGFWSADFGAVLGSFDSDFVETSVLAPSPFIACFLGLLLQHFGGIKF